MTQLIKQHLECVAARMKLQADKNRIERLFSEGDSIFLKLQPYVQASIAHHSSQKLAFRFLGPF
jgi:hypothetical protein